MEGLFVVACGRCPPSFKDRMFVAFPTVPTDIMTAGEVVVTIDLEQKEFVAVSGWIKA